MPNKGRNGNGGSSNGNGSKKKNGKKNGNVKRGTRNVGGIVQSMVSAALSNNSSNRRPMRQGLSRQRGSDFLGKITVQPAPATAAARIIATFPVSPSAYPGTRLAQISELWERYVFNSFSVRYVSAVPNTVACQLVLYIDTDPTDDPTVITDVDALIRQAVSQAGSQQWNFNQSKTTKLAIRSDGQLMYTGVDKQNKRFTQQGTAYLVQVTNPINFNGEPITSALEAGSLFLDWDISFQIAQINPAATIRQAPSPPLEQLYTKELTFGILRIGDKAVFEVTPHNIEDTGDLMMYGATLNSNVGSTSATNAKCFVDGKLAITAAGGAFSQVNCDVFTTYIGPGTHEITFTDNYQGALSDNNKLRMHATYPFDAVVTSQPFPPQRAAPRPFTVDVDELRKLIAECMTESNAPIGNAMASNPVDDIYDMSHEDPTSVYAYPAWDDEGLLDDDDPEYEVKHAQRSFAEELGNYPCSEPIGEPIVITAQTIDINTNVHISDDTRNQIDTAVRAIMARAPELCPYSLVVPFIRDEVDTDSHLNIDHDTDDL